MQQDYRTLAIYILTLFVVVLLIVLKKQQDHLTDLENDIVEAEITTISPDTLEEQTSIQAPVKTTKVPMRGTVSYTHLTLPTICSV